jgi:acyl carrier protein
VQVILNSVANGYECRVLRRDKDQWRTAAECRLTPSAPSESARDSDWDARADGYDVDVAQHYRRCLEAGIGYGPTFRGMRLLRAGNRESWGEVCAPRNLSLEGYWLHPALLDACLQITAGALGDRGNQVWLPVQVARYRLFRSPIVETSLRACARIAAPDCPDSICVNLQIVDRGGWLLAAIDGLLLKPTGRAVRESAPSSDAGQQDIVREILEGTRSDPHARLQEYLYAQLGKIMRLAVDEIPLDKPLNSLGLDSMMAFELRDQLERDLHVTVPFEVLLQDRSPRDFVLMLLDKLHAAQGSADGSVPSTESVPVESWIEGAI